MTGIEVGPPRSSPSCPEHVALNRASWDEARQGHASPTASAAGRWHPARRRGASSASRRRSSTCCPTTSRASTPSSSAAAPATSRPGWRGGAPGPSASTTRPSSSRPRPASSASTASTSRSCSATRSGSPTPTPRSTSRSASTAPRCGPTRTPGSPRPRACSARAAGCMFLTNHLLAYLTVAGHRGRRARRRAPQAPDVRHAPDGLARRAGIGRVPPRARRLDPAAARERLRGRGPGRDPGARGRDDDLRVDEPRVGPASGRARRPGRCASAADRRAGAPGLAIARLRPPRCALARARHRDGAQEGPQRMSSETEPVPPAVEPDDAAAEPAAEPLARRADADAGRRHRARAHRAAGPHRRPGRPARSATCASATGPSRRSAASRSRSTRARPTACSAPTAPARPRRSRWSAGCSRATRARSRSTARRSTSARSRPRPGIGYVPQELAIYPDLSARENLVFFGRLYGLGGAQLKDARRARSSRSSA